MIKRYFLATGMLIMVCVLSLGTSAFANTTDNTVYGSGSYGTCDYGVCGLTLTSSGAASLNVVPTGSGACTVQKDTVSVLTDNPTGYSVTMTTSTAQNTMTNGASSISASSGTAAMPVTLANNTWGYRIDGQGSFGAGPTIATSNSVTPSPKFAGVPASGSAAATVATASGAANPTVTTNVWFGICINTSQPSGSYSTTITYTAVTT